MFKNVTPVISNDHMFENLKYLVDRAKNGKYSSIFMFGMTGSGKTYNTNIIHERAPKVFFESKQDVSGADGTINANQTVKVAEQSQTQACVKVIAYELIGNKCYDLLSPSKGEVFLRVGKDKNTHVCNNVTKTATSAIELESKFSAVFYATFIIISSACLSQQLFVLYLTNIASYHTLCKSRHFETSIFKPGNGCHWY